jgi:DNA adenine methylase
MFRLLQKIRLVGSLINRRACEQQKDPLQGPLGMNGSKRKIALQLCERLPPHNAWVEAFCGSSAVTLAKKPAPIEVINDIDDQIVNLFRQLRKHPKTLCRLISLTPYARQELNHARSSKKPKDKLEKARRFFVESMMAVNGVFGEERGGFSYSQSYARNGREARVNRWYNLPDRIPEIVERLRGVRVEKKDALTLMKDFIDKPATLVYLDPPYFADRTNGYNKDANNEKFHTDLLKLANRSKCMIFISGYDNKLYRKMLSTKKGWSTRRIKTATKGSSGETHDRTEVVWMNKHFRKAQKSNRVPIRLSSKEKKSNKINPTRSHK